MTTPFRLQRDPSDKRTGRSTLAGVGLLALGLAWFAVDSDAAELVEYEGTGTRPVASGRLGDDEFVIEEIFQSHLPATLEKYGLRLSVHPHLGDWQRKDNMRLTTSLRYGLMENCELNVSSNLYFSHGNGDVRAFEDYGAANLRFGAKFDLGQPLFSGWETGAGVDYESPIGRPPPELTDGLRHLRSYVTFSHRCETHPNLRIFVGFRADVVRQTSVPGEFSENSFQESSTGITGGWVLDRDRLHYTFEATYDTNRLIGHGGEDIISVRPGVLWEIPARGRSQARSNWLVGVSVNSTFGPGGTSLGASFKLRYNSDLKNLFRSHRHTATP